jgi:hypothetical protein
MPLKEILDAWDRPVKQSIVRDVISYMKNMPKDKEALLLECAEHLEQNQSLGAVLAVVHALNDSEIFLRCRDDDALESDLTQEFERLLREDDKKEQSALTPPS